MQSLHVNGFGAPCFGLRVWGQTLGARAEQDGSTAVLPGGHGRRGEVQEVGALPRPASRPAGITGCGAQLRLAPRQRAAYLASNLCVPCLFMQCKRAVDRIVAEDLLWL